MKTLLISFILLLSVIGVQAQTVIEFAKASPTITITDNVDNIIKTAVVNIKARSSSTINVDGTIYKIAYINSVYTVSIEFWKDAANTEKHLEVLFEGTRVADVRTFMKTELHSFYENV